MFSRRQDQVSSHPVAAVSFAALAAMVSSLLVASPATAITLANIAADPAAWAATPYSPLTWGEVPAAGNSAAFGFDAEAGNLIDGAGVGTGFTAVLPSSAASTAPYYTPADISVVGGKLNILASNGIFSGTANTQDNTLGVGIDVEAAPISITTTFTMPTGASGYAQGGLWLGPDDKNFIKLAVIANGTSARQIQLAKETTDVSRNPVAPATTSADQIVVATTSTALGTAPIKLTLTLTPATAEVSGSYQLGTATPVDIGSISGVPASFFDGTKVTGSKPTTVKVDTFAGIFGTKRNMPATTPLTFAFDSFGMTAGSVPAPGDITPPAAPTAAAALAGDAVVDASWTASTSTDTAGYRVFRGVEPTVSTTGTPVSGAALVTATTFRDTTVTNGTTYYYVVIAEDTSGNRSISSNEVIAAPRAANSTAVKIDFTKTNGVPEAGYFADWGEAYGTRTGSSQGSGAYSYGWTDTEGNLASLVGNGRDRNRAGIDPLVDSTIHMQYGDVANGTGTSGVLTEGRWNLAVPDGLYTVTYGVGDMPNGTNYDSTNVINVEGSIGIEKFVGTATKEYETVTSTVGVWDGKLTIDAKGGINTKLGFIEVTSIAAAPHVDTVLPENRLVGHDVTAGVSATIKTPFAGSGVLASSLPGNVHLYNAATNVEVPTTVGTSGGNDVISLSPSASLAANTTYRFVVSSGVKDGQGTAFKPFSSLFTTGNGVTTGATGFTPATNISFEKIEMPTAAGKYWTSFAFGPDGKLYGTTIGQGIFRFVVAADGSLGAPEDLGHAGVNIIGLLFDKSATASDPKLWVTMTTASFSEQGQWVSSVHLLSGPNLAIDRTIFKGLPRSLADHLTNSMAYGPDGRIYFNQGSNQGAGDLDNAWGQRGEQKLSAATLVFDPANTQVAAAAAGGTTIDVQTAGGGTYDPFAASAPLMIYASGIRNGYDLVWHSNGHLYVATNGTAGGANTPGVTANPDGTFTRKAAAGIPGFSTVDGRDVTEQCARRGYTGGTVAPTSNIPTQRDLLFDVQAGKYYGHPNPERCEFVLNAGNDTATPTAPGTKESKYAAGQKADPNYGGVAFDFEFNKSPDGAIEYKSSAFGGQLKGRLVIARFSNNNDLIFIQPSQTTGKILGAQTSVGITGQANTAMTGVDGFNDPLEVVEDTRNGNLYVNQYDRAGTDQKLYLLRVPANQQATPISASTDSVVFSTVKATTSGAKSVVVRNNTAQPVTLATALTGGQAAEFAVTNGTGTIAANSTRTVAVTFTPANTPGQRSTTLRFTAGVSTIDVGLYGLSMNGIEGVNEPPLNDVLGTLGYQVNPGWLTLTDGTGEAAKGDEVLDPLFIKAGAAAPTILPVAQYAPEEAIPFGWYTGAGAAADRNLVGTIDVSGYQSLLPPVTAGSSTTFDPGANTFGLYYYSNKFLRFGYTEDGLNTGIAHRARVYPAKDRAGTPIINTYIIAFEDASNGDYQDYVFVVSGIKPAAQTGGAGVRVDFTTKAGGLATGYLRDYGQPFGVRSDADQGTGLSFGWRNDTTLVAVDIATGGTSGAGNGRDRNTAQPDQRLDSFMHMQTAAASSTFNGTRVDALWEMQVANGQYDVTVAVGDPVPQTGTESNRINVEGVTAITGFIPSGTAGTATRHSTVTTRVTVVDGELTIDAKGGTNTKISYIDVVPVAVAPDADPTGGAQVKVRFQTDGIPTPAGWTADTGGAYSTSAGFGWIDGATVQPVDRSGAIVYRSTATAGIAYPSNALQKGVASLQQPTGAIWERAVANGTYEVMVSVGDSALTNSVHTVTAEGQPVINGFTPTGATPFQTGKRTVTVSDGRMTIAGTGTDTKINWVSIKGTGLDGPPPTVDSVKFDFATATAPVPAGWVRETGAAFSPASGFGWLANGTPADRTTFSRYRATAKTGITFPTDPTLRTFHQMQSGISTNVLNGVWEYVVPNGTYRVSATVGDANFLDSIHGVSVDGTALVSAFVPTGTVPFATGTKDVVVTDGRLTLSPTGTNTKVASITVEGVGIGAPTLIVTANGANVETSYTGPATSVTLAAQATGGATVSSVTYTLDGGASTPYTTPISLSTTGTTTLVATVVDSTGRTTALTLTFTIQPVGGTVKLRNEQVSRVNGTPMPGFYEDWLAMGRINTVSPDHMVIDSATVTVINTDTRPLQINALTITGTNAADFVVTTPTGATTVAPGASVPVTVKFVSTTGIRGVRAAQLTIASNDPVAPTTVVQLRGQYMLKPEGADEPSLNMLRQLWGWGTNVGTLNIGDEMRTSALNGDEVRSLLWKRADASLPVVARQLAAFHGCCAQTASIKLSGTTQAVHAGPYAQSIFPLQADGNPTELRVSPTTTFGITVSGQTTNNVNYMAVKTWPVKGRDGKIVPNAWFVGFDYISTPNQCGVGATNCDFQDNVYLVTNILPVASNDSTAPAAPTNPTATITGNSVRVGWTGVSATGLGGYHVERATAATGPWTRLTTQAVSTTSYLDSGLPLVDTLYYRVLATDPSGNTSAATTAVPIGIVGLSRTMLIKAGGPTTTVNGRTWETDVPYATGGRLYTNPRISDILGTTDDGLYWSERSDTVTFAYNIPIADGSYTVKLHFAEPYFGATGGGAGGVGKRVFDVNYEEGAKEIVGLDLNAKVPPMTAYIDSRTVTVVGGNLDIDFAATTNFPSISAIEIIPN